MLHTSAYLCTTPILLLVYFVTFSLKQTSSFFLNKKTLCFNLQIRLLKKSGVFISSRRCFVEKSFYICTRNTEVTQRSFRKIFYKNFADQKNISIFALASHKDLFFKRCNAKIAQLVERNLAKVEVAGSNPVFRST